VAELCGELKGVGSVRCGNGIPAIMGVGEERLARGQPGVGEGTGVLAAPSKDPSVTWFTVFGVLITGKGESYADIRRCKRSRVGFIPPAENTR